MSRRDHSPIELRYCNSSAVSLVGEAWNTTNSTWPRPIASSPRQSRDWKEWNDWLSANSHLIGEHRHREFSRKKGVQNFVDYFPVRTTSDVCFETDVRKFWFRCDMDRHVTALLENRFKINDEINADELLTSDISVFIWQTCKQKKTSHNNIWISVVRDGNSFLTYKRKVVKKAVTVTGLDLRQQTTATSSTSKNLHFW